MASVTVSAAPLARPEPLDRWSLAAIALVAIALVARWSAVWRETPDFAHGWLVPVFAAYLAWERRSDCPPRESVPPAATVWVIGLLATTALGLAARLLLGPFPNWPAALWAYSAFGWAAIWGVLAHGYGFRVARHFLFPLLFTATAIPWPTALDLHIVLPLRTVLASLSAEVLHAIGYPAVPHGTIIEVGLGNVGIDEACSGIRSLQASLMISLLVGEIFRLRWRRRIGLIAAGLLLAVTTNFLRTCFLAWQGAVAGPKGVEAWHDLTGNILMLVALGGLAAIGWRWRCHGFNTPAPNRRESSASRPDPRHASWAVIAAVFAVEIPVLVWYGSSAAVAAPPAWSVALPSQADGFREEPFSSTAQELLGCDQHAVAQWRSDSGELRAGYILDWTRGNVARQTIALHNPEVCLPGSGQSLRARHGRIDLPLANGGRLPFQLLEFSGAGSSLFVFYVVWDVTFDRELPPASDTSRQLWWANRLEEVRHRRSQFHARAVAYAIYGASDARTAAELFATEGLTLFVRPSTGSHDTVKLHSFNEVENPGGKMPLTRY